MTPNSKQFKHKYILSWKEPQTSKTTKTNKQLFPLLRSEEREREIIQLLPCCRVDMGIYRPSNVILPEDIIIKASTHLVSRFSSALESIWCFII